ncbi:MAG TPA: formylglycine-generating enzyme family protein [Methylobacter sp.]|jgi:formylglycine-generating enzyme required for sulfatase activity
MLKPFKLVLLVGLLLGMLAYMFVLDEEPNHPVMQSKVHDQEPLVKIEMVKLPIGILMGKYEVTQGQWRAVMGNNPAFFSNCGDNCPVEQVNWDDVQDFIQSINKQTGSHYRLPTEDEWYSACQAASSHTHYCGSGSIDAVAWYKGDSGETTNTVGHKQANAWDLYDMSGNVWEWTSTCWSGDCSGGCKVGNCPSRVSRGGSWDDSPEYARADYRFRTEISDRYNTLGFRLAQDP